MVGSKESSAPPLLAGGDIDIICCSALFHVKIGFIDVISRVVRCGVISQMDCNSVKCVKGLSRVKTIFLVSRWSSCQVMVSWKKGKEAPLYLVGSGGRVLRILSRSCTLS